MTFLLLLYIKSQFTIPRIELWTESWFGSQVCNHARKHLHFRIIVIHVSYFHVVRIRNTLNFILQFIYFNISFILNFYINANVHVVIIWYIIEFLVYLQWCMLHFEFGFPALTQSHICRYEQLYYDRTAHILTLYFRLGSLKSECGSFSLDLTF
jgi:hypothetical protein